MEKLNLTPDKNGLIISYEENKWYVSYSEFDKGGVLKTLLEKEIPYRLSQKDSK